MGKPKNSRGEFLPQLNNTTLTSIKVDKVQLKVEDLYLSFGGVNALTGVSLEVNEGEILAIIGPNGAGKTCVLNCINGFYRPQKGGIYFEGRKISGMSPERIAKLGIARTFQNVESFKGLTVVENLLTGRHVYLKPTVLTSIFSFGPEDKKELQQRRVVEKIIDFLEMEAIRNQPAGTIPYGLQKRVALGRALALEPKLLLVDEVMAGMNVEEKEDMARFILDVNDERDTTIVLIEHDMELVMDIADRVVVLDLAHKIAEGTPREIRINPDVIRAYLGGE